MHPEWMEGRRLSRQRRLVSLSPLSFSLSTGLVGYSELLTVTIAYSDSFGSSQMVFHTSKKDAVRVTVG